MNTTTLKHLDFNNPEVAFRGVTNQELVRSYWLFKAIASPAIAKLNSSITPTLVKYFRPAEWVVKETAFKHFCGGETIEECLGTTERLASNNVKTILDYSVEGEKSEAVFQATANEVVRTIVAASTSKEVPFSVFKISGIVNPTLLTKLQEKKSLSERENIDYEAFLFRFDTICKEAKRLKVRLFVDAEESWFQAIIDELVLDMMRHCNEDQPIIWNTYQLYLARNKEVFDLHLNTAKKEGFWLGAKLVRGAYMEKEAADAAVKGNRNPINGTKAATDTLYNKIAWTALENIEHTAFCLGTHNEESCRLIAEGMEELNVPKDDDRIWFAQLLGMSNNLSNELALNRYNVAKYVPYGPVKAVMPYLIRRAQENTSVAGQTSRELDLIKREMHRRGLSKLSVF